MQTVTETTQVVRRSTQQGKLLNQYLKLKKLGDGPYSTIKLMRNVQDGCLYAMKKYNLGLLKKKNKLLKKQNGKPIYTTAAQEVLNEVEVMKGVSHENIAQLVEIIRDHEEEKLYLIMEYCAGGDIADWNHKTLKFSLNQKISQPKQLKSALLELAEAVLWLHEHGIVHRDIKPQNIMLDEKGKVKVIDFGRAVKLESMDQKLRGSEGTYEFMAPQSLSQMFPEGFLGQLSDMWSLGVTLYTLVFRVLPFHNQLLLHLFHAIEKGEYTLPQPVPKEYEDLVPIIQKLLVVDPRQRMTNTELVAALKHSQ